MKIARGKKQSNRYGKIPEKMSDLVSRAPGLVDRVFAVHAGSRGFDSHRRHMSERFFRSNRPGYPHPVCSGLENSGFRVAVDECSVTERRRWRPPYQAGKTVHVHANTLQTGRRRTHGAGYARPWFRTAEPLGERRYENLITHRAFLCCTNGPIFDNVRTKMAKKGITQP